MNGKKTIKLTAAILCSMLIFSGCEFSFSPGGYVPSGSYDVQGRTVNAMAPSASSNFWEDGSYTLAGAQIQVLNLDNPSYTETAYVNNSGYFSFGSLPSGRYLFTGSKSGWIFVPREIRIFGDSAFLPDLLAYHESRVDYDTIVILTQWENTDIDIDSYLVIDNDQNEDNGNAGIVYFGNTSGYGVSLDRDITTSDMDFGYPAVETVRIYANPIPDGTGQLRFYLQSITDDGLTGMEFDPSDPLYQRRANAVVHVMQGYTHYGTWFMPIETLEDTLGILKIDVTDGIPVSYLIKSFGNEGGIKSIDYQEAL